MTVSTKSTFPVFNTSALSDDVNADYFDLVRLQDRPDIPREFLHRHTYYHLLWLSEAEGVHLLDFERFEVRANSVFFINPGQLHSWKSMTKPKGYVINFSSEFFLQMFPSTGDMTKYPFFNIASEAPVLYLAQSQHDQLLPLLRMMEREALGHAVSRLDVLKSYLLVLLIELRRLYPESNSQSASAHNYSLTKQYKLLIEDHYLQMVSVRDYAAKLHVTERQLNEALKRTQGKTAGQLLQERLVLEAKRLLSNTDSSIKQTALQLNFDDIAYFCRFFKKHALLTPSEFKKRTLDIKL